MNDSKNSDPLDDLSALMAELNDTDSHGLTDSAVGLILNCVDETDSAVKAAQLEDEMVKSIANLIGPPSPAPAPEAKAS